MFNQNLPKGSRTIFNYFGNSFWQSVYFFDRDGNDWEFIQYLTDDLAKRHDYTIPDK